jgi:hypothetical protein
VKDGVERKFSKLKKDGVAHNKERSRKISVSMTSVEVSEFVSSLHHNVCARYPLTY